MKLNLNRHLCTMTVRIHHLWGSTPTPYKHVDKVSVHDDNHAHKISAQSLSCLKILDSRFNQLACVPICCFGIRRLATLVCIGLLFCLFLPFSIKQIKLLYFSSNVCARNFCIIRPISNLLEYKFIIC